MKKDSNQKGFHIPKFAATIAFYGPDNMNATKAVVGIVRDDGEVVEMEKWYQNLGDIRLNENIEKEMLEFIRVNYADEIARIDRILGCPHEEGIDYPIDRPCPKCPFWANRERGI